MGSRTDVFRLPKRLFAPDDLYELTSPGEPQLSPDGTELLYVVAGMDRASDGYRADLYMRSTAGGSERLVIRGRGRLRRPAFSPSGDRIAYIDGAPGEKPQIWLVDLRDGSAHPLTDGGEVSDLTWSPDGREIAYCALVPGIEPGVRKIREFTRIPVAADGLGVLEPQGPSLHVIDVATRRARLLAAGQFTYRVPAWSPDGSEIAVARLRHYSLAVTRGGELAVVSADAERVRVLAEDVNFQQAPAIAWAPDSSALAYCTSDLHVSAAPVRVVQVKRDGSGRQTLSGRHDRFPCQGVVADTRPGASPAGLAYSPDGAWVYYLAGDRGSVPLFSCAADGSGEWRQLTAPRQCVAEFSVARDGRIAYVSQTDTRPDQVWLLGGDDPPIQLTDTASALWSGLTTVPMRRFMVRVGGGPEVEAWIQLPATTVPAPPPAILSIHGGPHGMFGYCMVSDVQGWLAEGWAVIQVNPPGSAGYGFEFARAVWNDWGGADLEYQLAAVDHCVERGWIDPHRVAVTGTSYGGFIVNRIVTRTDRFRCAVTENAPSDLFSGFGTSDLGLLYERPHIGGVPWRDPERYVALSPLRDVANVHTPILILAAEDDRRQPAAQSEEWFTALIVEGKEAVLVRYPYESHFWRLTGRPSNRVHRLRRVRAWLSEHLSGP